MIDLCRYAVECGEKSGADEVEALWVRKVSTSIEAELGEINRASSVRDEGLRIRIVKDKAMSSIFTYHLDKDGVKKAVDRAVKAAKASQRDDNWHSLPSPGVYPHVGGWDAALETIGPEKLVEPVSAMLGLLPRDITLFLAGHQVLLQERACINSNALEHEDRGTAEVVVAAGVGMLDTGVTPAFAEVSFLRKYGPAPQETVNTVVERINLFRKKDTASSGKFTIIFSPEALEALLLYTVFKALCGDNVARGKSLLAGREGEKMASSSLSLYDDGTSAEGLASSDMDDEGIPRQKTPLIEEGILQGFIWNDYWAKRTGNSSTGNAFYDDRVDEMHIQQSTMVLTPGDFRKEELFDIKDGYYVLGAQGAHSANPESGDFSVVCSPAYRIRNGEISGGVVGMMLSDNVFRLLENVEAVGRDRKVGEVSVLPHVRILNVNVAAK